MKMRLSEWAKRNYTDESRPCSATLCAMARRGEVPGAIKLISGWWVDEKQLTSNKAIDSMRKLAGNDEVLKDALGL